MQNGTAGKLPVGRRLNCSRCDERFKILPRHPGARLINSFGEKTATAENNQTWEIPCPKCGRGVSENNFVPPTHEEMAAARNRRFAENDPCPRCGASLASNRALMCAGCGFRWFRCPGCDAEWERGTRVCHSCKVTLEDLARKN